MLDNLSSTTSIRGMVIRTPVHKALEEIKTAKARMERARGEYQRARGNYHRTIARVYETCRPYGMTHRNLGAQIGMTGGRVQQIVEEVRSARASDSPG